MLVLCKRKLVQLIIDMIFLNIFKNRVGQTCLVRLPRTKLSPFLFPSEPPVFVRPFESIEFVKGSNIKLEGTVSGSDPFEMSVFLNDKLIRNDKKHSIGIENSVVTVEVLDCASGDAGAYRCVLTNDVGETSCSCQVLLKGQFHLGVAWW